jgi:kinesin family protein 11
VSAFDGSGAAAAKGTLANGRIVMSDAMGSEAGTGQSLARTTTTAVNAKVYEPDELFGPDATQADVYNRVALPLAELLPTGNNACILAYGQTGSGRHLMITLARKC